MRISLKLYDLIWRRTIASQMEQSLNLETTYYIKGEEILLKAGGSIEKFKGFKEVYNYQEKMMMNKNSKFEY